MVAVERINSVVLLVMAYLIPRAKQSVGHLSAAAGAYLHPYRSVAHALHGEHIVLFGERGVVAYRVVAHSAYHVVIKKLSARFHAVKIVVFNAVG